ncbi:hypothetical protein [Flavonifractor sp. An306]|nr:hypothetical protein [Flavonifractor sp. An306]
MKQSNQNEITALYCRLSQESNQNEITALYCRLSQDDGADGESNSIQNQ